MTNLPTLEERAIQDYSGTIEVGKNETIIDVADPRLHMDSIDRKIEPEMPYVDYVMISEPAIKKRIEAMVDQIVIEYSQEKYDGQDLVFMTLLRGAKETTAYIREVIDQKYSGRIGKTNIIWDECKVSSTKGTTVGGKLKIRKKPKTNLNGKHVLVIDDIIDSGTTVETIDTNFSRRSLYIGNPSRNIEKLWNSLLSFTNFITGANYRGAKSFNSIVLLQKRDVEEHNGYQATYTGFSIPYEWVLGVGLDTDNLFRRLPFVAALNQEKYLIDKKANNLPKIRYK
jgi:hypoxanthine phosphoribosyltransferase